MTDSEQGKRSSRSRRRPGRRGRRDMGHAAALAEAGNMPQAKIPDHPKIPKETPALITSDAEVAEFVAHIRDTGLFSFDTEFIGEETYHRRICLVQLATADRLALVDPLAGVDLRPIWEVVADADVETLVHAGRQDFEPVYRELGRVPENVYDLQIAAGFADRVYPLSLGVLLSEFVGVSLAKAFTFTRWDQRPLPDVHMRYAADDVRFLIAARERLEEELERFGHATWVRDEMGTLSEPSWYTFDPNAAATRLVSNRRLRPKSIHVLRELLIFRDKIAQERDTPPRTFLGDDVLIRIARDTTKSRKALEAVKGLPWPVIEKHGDEIIERIAEAAERPSDELPVRTLPDEGPRDRIRIDSLFAIASAWCRARGVAPELVGSRREIAQYYWSRTQKKVTAPERLVIGWRHELLGSLLGELLDGTGRVEFSWRDGRLEGERR